MRWVPVAQLQAKAQAKEKKEARLFLMWTLNYFFPRAMAV